jgi:UDP-2,3-diacylglucosamine pyrophosphatase LpxH
MHDLVVLSDLHLGKGRNPETGRYYPLETFFYDEDLRRFCRNAGAEAKARGTLLRLVFNGDTFDLLRIEPGDGPSNSRREQRFGADRTPSVAAAQMAQILLGHPVFVETLAEVLAEGHEIVMLPGNHDLEVQWEPVQRELRAAVRARLLAKGAPVEALERFRFAPWFWYEPGRIWIEHGCQYDPECAFRYPLRSILVGKLDDDGRLLERDMPLGNFIQRYLYNGFGPLTFIVPSTRANGAYSRWLLLNEPRLLLGVLRKYVPFAFQVLRRLSQSKGTERVVLQHAHEVELGALAEQSGLGSLLRQIDALKNIEGDLLQTVRQQGFRFLRFLALGTGVALASTGLWGSGFLAISALGAGVGLKSLLFLLLNFVLIATVFGGSAALLLRSAPPTSPTPLRQGAQKLVDLLDVPVVTFGHTHDETIWRLHRNDGGRAWYFNTGTWIAVFTSDALIPRERVQYTFLRLRGHEAELLHWSPGRDEALPVVLLDEEGTDLVPAPAAQVVPT